MRKITLPVLKIVWQSAIAVTMMVILTSSSAFSQKSAPMTDAICCPKIVAGVNPILFFRPNKLYKFTIVLANPDTCNWTIGQKILTSPDQDAFTLVEGPTTIPAGSTAQLIIDFGPTDSLHHYSGQLLLLSAAPCTDTIMLSWDFSNPTSGVHSTSRDGFELGQNYPNPVNSLTTFSYITPTEAPVTLSISDITGSIVKTISNGYVSAGEHSITTDLSELSSGSYIVLLQSGGITLTRQLFIAH